jgi:hypothetical protein|tara:strand:- start:476 stop:1021 length:546 start_codon:yes stop_codon:yes gene_type:complete
MSNDANAVTVLGSNLSAVLQEMRPYVEGRGTFDDMLVDNACSAVSKIIISLTDGQGSSGLSQTVGGANCINIVTSIVPILLSSLPLQSDHEEDGPVYVQCLGNILQTQPTIPIVVQHLSRIVYVLVKAIPEITDDAVRKSVTMRIKYACTRFQGVDPQSLVQGLTQEESNWVGRIVSGQEQ